MVSMKIVLVLCCIQALATASVIRRKRQASMSGSANANININSGAATASLGAAGANNLVTILQNLQQQVSTANPSLATTIQNAITQLQSGNLNTVIGQTMASLNPSTASNLQQVQAVLTALVNNGNTQLQPLLTYLQANGPPIATSLFPGFNINGSNQILSTLQNTLNQLLNSGNSLSPAISNAISQFQNIINSGQTSIFLPALNAVIQSVGSGATAANIVNSLMSSQLQIIPNALLNILAPLNSFITGMTNNVQSAIGQSTSYFQGLAGLAGNSAQQFTGAAGNALTGMTGPIASMANTFTQALAQLMAIPQSLLTIPGAMLQGIPQFLSLLFSAPMAILSSLFQPGNPLSTGATSGATGSNGLPSGSLGANFNFGG